jgi:methylmalonyl-CoA/ethylmalonyl-CoA epimerase
MKKLSHVGIAVKSIEESSKLFGRLFNVQDVKTETIPDQKVKVAFFHIGEASIEVIEATSPDSPIAKFIEKRGEGVHHLSFEVDDIQAELVRLKSVGFQLIDDKPRQGADGCLVAFIHPKSTNGVLIEISQKIRK